MNKANSVPIYKANSVPIYNAVLEGNEDGITCVSLVDFPAVEVDFMQFDKVRPMLHVEGNRLIGVLLRADYPIYRISECGEPYYIRFTREQIWQIAEKFQRTDKVESLMHDGNAIEGVKMVSLFVKDTARGIDPKGFDEITDGSLFAVYQVENKEVLNLIKEGVIKGFSIEGYFGREKSKFSNNMKVLKSLLMKFLDESQTIKVSDELTIVAADGGEIAEGKEVAYIESDEPVADGEYEWNGKKVTIEGGKVAKIEDAPAAEAEPAEDLAEEQPTEEPAAPAVTREEFDALIKRIEAIEKVVFPNGEGEEGEPTNDTLASIRRRVFGRK